jgi:hypothetical protein
MTDLTRAKEGGFAGSEERKAERLPPRASAVVILVLSLVSWAFVIFLGIALCSAFS